MPCIPFDVTPLALSMNAVAEEEDESMDLFVESKRSWIILCIVFDMKIYRYLDIYVAMYT
jgi:hypothetical protein